MPPALPVKTRLTASVTSQVDHDGLTRIQRTFVETYIANGGNGTRAYLACYPNAKPNTGATEAWKYLRIPKIAEAITKRRSEVFAKHRLDAELALDLIAMAAKVDIADCYDEEGTMLPVREWPLDVRMCVKEVKEGQIKFIDPLKARELIALDGGRIKRTVDVNTFDHAGYLEAVAKRHLEQRP